MKAIAYNYLGEVVYENTGNERLHAKSSQKLTPENAKNPARSLRISPENPESSWLCAISFAMQNRPTPIPIDEFFKITTAHLSTSEKKNLIELFVIDCLHAFYRIHKHKLEISDGSTQNIANLNGEFERLGLPKALLKISSLQNLAEPQCVAALRAACLRGAIEILHLPGTRFDPLDNGRTSPHAESASPWSIAPESNLLAHHETPPKNSKKTTVVGVFFSGLDKGKIQVTGSGDLFVDLADDSITLSNSRNKTSLNDRQQYLPISPETEAASSLSTTLMLAHKKMREGLPTLPSKWLEFVAGLVGIPTQTLNERLSAEQIDACGIAAHNFSSRKSFILADETGLGKGRTLAALAKAFLRSNKKVVFITEKKHLFSDFWRDLIDVHPDGELPATPFLLHPQGRIIARDGSIVVKSPSTAKYKENVATHVSPSPLLFTTYSQFNRDAKQSDKHQLIEKHLKDGLLILDESHNAAGDSQTRKNILALIEKSSKCIFSSATYAKHEMAFELYESATPLTKNEMAMLLSSYGAIDPHATSNALASGLVTLGSMVRREHTPDDMQESKLLLPSDAQLEKINPARDLLHECLASLFELQGHVELAKRDVGEDTEASWMKLGGTLSRLCKQFNLLSKIEMATTETARHLLDDKKVVIALESTFESFINAQILWNQKHKLDASWLVEEDEEDEAPQTRLVISDDSFSFASLFKLIIESMASEEDLAKYKSAAISDAKHAALRLADTLPNWLASPIDLLRMKIEKLGFKVGEISGRSKRIQTMGDGRLELVAGDADQREAIVKEFNDGLLDVLILTQAGASGISLHASSSFKDQRTRVFMELEVCTNPAQRLQFLGRVRRKGQVRPPEYCVLSSGSPYEHRLLERAVSKQALLSGLTAGTQKLASGALNLGSKILTSKGDRIAREWLVGHRVECKKLGIFLSGKDDAGLAEKLLKRVALLPSNQQDDVFSFLSRAIELDTLTPIGEGELGAYHQGALLARSFPIWGPAMPLQSRRAPEPFTPTVHAMEWVCLPDVANIGSITISERLAESANSPWSLGIDSLLKAIRKSIASPQGNQLAALRLHDMRNLAPHLEPGSKIRMSHPSTGRPIDGMVTAIAPPDRNDWLIYPSQWALSAAFPGQDFEASISLASFFNDAHAYISKTAPPPPHFWDVAKPKTHHFTTIDGHCGYSRWYATLVGAQQTVKFTDSTGTPRELNALPFDVTIEDIQEWKIPLIDPRLTLQVLQRDTHLSLDDAIFPDAQPQLSIAPTGGGWNLTFDRQLHDSVVDFNLERRLGPRKYHSDDSGDKITRFVSAQNIHAAIGLLHTRKCRFTLPPTRAKWHANALELLLSTARATKNTKRK